MRRKEEIDKQLKRDKTGRTTPVALRAPTPYGENNEFDVEVYEYEPEEYSYRHASTPHSESIVDKPDKPFYIPLTDVPYPGEVDSTYDLKRLAISVEIEQDIEITHPQLC